jgi:tripartite-type tricarboxylate transporter receptor subunit TctC
VAILWLDTGGVAIAQERICPDGKRAYFGVCPDDGNNSRPLAPAPNVVPDLRPIAPSQNNISTAVSFTVPNPPGGPTDTIVRNLAQNLGSQAVVENIAGASGLIGLTRFVQTQREGVAYFALSASTLRSLKLTNQAALIQQTEPVAILGTWSYLILTRASSPIKSIQDLVNWGKGKRLAAGTSGEGTLSELCLNQLAQVLGININLVPYKGAAPALADVIEGHTDVTCLPASVLSNDSTRNRLSILAVTENTPNSSLPYGPTLESLGIRGVMKGEWLALLQSKQSDSGSSSAVLGTIHKITMQPEFRSRLSQYQFNQSNMDLMNPAAARNFIANELR